jgi:hydrogenase expression/formation protein HypE
MDPLYVANEGLFVAVVAAEAATAIRDRLARAYPTGSPLRLLGRWSQTHPGKLVIRSAIGGRRVVNMLVGDQLPQNLLDCFFWHGVIT